MNRLDMESVNIINENIEKIGDLFPNVIVEGSNGKAIDFDLLKQELTENLVLNNKEKYELTWPGKREAIIKANMVTKNTLRPIKEKSVDFDNTNNIYIEGDNLEALKILQESYLNRIKCIYIDPPYNTGSDFIYNDNFYRSSTSELLDSGQIDNDGRKLITNSSSNGRFHSVWLSMMYPRLKLARNLLAKNGIIYISINDSEVDNLRKICDEIFGENNFVAKLVWANNEGVGSSDSKFFKVKHEYILCYAKNIEYLLAIKNVEITDKDRYKLSDKYESTRGKYQLVKLSSASLQYSKSLDYTLEAPDGTLITPSYNTDKDKAIWRWSLAKYNWGLENDFIEWKKDKNGIWQVYTKQYVNCDKDGNLVERTKKPLGFINEFSSTQGSKELFNLFQVKTFSYPKPTQLIKYLIDRFSYEENDIILDFFSGSATTAQAVMESNVKDHINKKYIMIQLPELCNEFSEAYQAGYKTITDIGEERIRRSGKKIKEETDASIDYGFRVFKVDSSNMKDVYYRPENIVQEQLSLFESNIKEDRTSEDLLIQVMLDLGLTIDLKIEEKNILQNKVYFVDDNVLIACFDDEIDLNIIEEICSCKPFRMVFKDSSFKSDKDKINLSEKVKRYNSDTQVSII